MRGIRGAFDAFLRSGKLEIVISSGGKDYKVEPIKITLPQICKGYSANFIKGDSSRKFLLTLYFQPSGQGRVCIRHAGVPIIEDVSEIYSYGLEETVLASGFVHGYIDADFLNPGPQRGAFIEDREWVAFLEALSQLMPSIEAEVEGFKSHLQETRLKEVCDKAVELAARVLRGSDAFKGLIWPGGYSANYAPRAEKGTHQSRGRTGERKGIGVKEDPEAFKIKVSPLPFVEGPLRHSRILQEGLQDVIIINTLNPHFILESQKGEDAQTQYVAACIGKEVMAHNNPDADEALEHNLTFQFCMRQEVRLRK